jgi:hypothetical protein
MKKYDEEFLREINNYFIFSRWKLKPKKKMMLKRMKKYDEEFLRLINNYLIFSRWMFKQQMVMLKRMKKQVKSVYNRDIKTL